MRGRSGRLVARTMPVAAVDDATRAEMWGLFGRHYEDVDEASFMRDLDGKTHAIVARDSGDGSVQGFSTLVVHATRFDGRRVVVLFSGDTIVAPEYWGQKALQNEFGRAITRAKLRHPFTPVWWFLISKGYKTYLLLTRNFAEHWPRHDKGTPEPRLRLLDALARARFGDAWRPDEGVVRFDEPRGRLRPGVAPLDDGLLEAPDVAFFHRANPGWEKGDELACLGRVDATSWARYLAKQAKRRAARAAGRLSWAPS